MTAFITRLGLCQIEVCTNVRNSSDLEERHLEAIRTVCVVHLQHSGKPLPHGGTPLVSPKHAGDTI